MKHYIRNLSLQALFRQTRVHLTPGQKQLEILRWQDDSEHRRNLTSRLLSKFFGTISLLAQTVWRSVVWGELGRETPLQAKSRTHLFPKSRKRFFASADGSTGVSPERSLQAKFGKDFHGVGTRISGIANRFE
jgi:hypothetical protein